MSKKSESLTSNKARKKAEKQVKNDIKKQVRKMPLAVLISIIVFFAIGAVGGYFTYGHLTKNDTFVLNGETTITLTVGAVYDEQGAKAVSFGKDCTKKIQTEGAVDTSKSGVYNIIYTVDDFRYKGVKRVRTIIVEEVAADGE